MAAVHRLQLLRGNRQRDVEFERIGRVAGRQHVHPVDRHVVDQVLHRDLIRLDEWGYPVLPGGSLAASVSGDDLAAARAELQASGYKGEPVIVLEVAGSISQTASRVLVQNMKDVGFVVDQQPRDWPTVLARRAKKEGWSMFPVYSNGTAMFSPLSHFYIGNTCSPTYPGWSCDERIPKLLKTFTQASDLEERRKIAAEIQTVAYELTPSVMWGQFTIPAGYRNDLKNLIQSDYPMFWQVEKS